MLGEYDELHGQKTSILLGIPADYIKKDYFVTKAIQALTGIENEYFDLIFQGGTSLSKGHQIISRLSEDIDFRIILKPAAKKLGKSNRRKHLREFRNALKEALLTTGFKVPDNAVTVFYEGRFMRINAEFNDEKNSSYLKPHIAIECFVGELALTPKIANITSLVKTTLGEECQHNNFPVSCVALDETAAEKWVALTRRIAGTQTESRKSDKHLVRHLYDLYHLSHKKLLTGEYQKIVSPIMQNDKVLFQKHNQEYVNDPLRTSELALDLLYQQSQWQTHWDVFLANMVYEQNKPTFINAYNELQLLSKNIFSALKAQQEVN